MKIFFLAVGIFSIIFTLLPFIKSDKWWIRIFDYPRFQIMGMALISLGGLIYYSPVVQSSDIILISILALCLLYQFFVIIPYTPFYALQVKTSPQSERDGSLGLFIANVLMENKNSSKLLKIIKDCNPDIIIALETNKWWQSQLDILKEDFPTTMAYPLENTYGMLLYSRLDLVDCEIRFLVEDDVPSICTKVKMKNGKIVSLYGLHPTPPVPGENNASTERDAELLIVGKEVKKSPMPVIVAGDLNDVAWSYTTKLFQKISGLLDPRIGRGLFNTFNAKYPMLRWPLDHVFHSNHFKVIKLQRLSFFDSDHFPIYINLHLDPKAQYQQEEPTATNGEKAEAKEKIEKV